MENPAIIHSDNHIMVVIKSAGTPTQPDESGDIDMLSILKEHRRVTENKVGEAFVGLVHRLDRVTGGVMVFAKTSKGAARLSEQLREVNFTKRYLAVIKGVPKENSGILVHHLFKNEKQNKVDIVPQLTTGAKRAELSYTVKSKTEKHSLIEVNLHTGRSHQIRAQFAHIGHPLIGDQKYGSRGDQRSPMSVNLALWAYELSFNHPTTGERLKFIVNPPETAPWTDFDFSRKSHKTPD